MRVERMRKKEERRACEGIRRRGKRDARKGGREYSNEIQNGKDQEECWEDKAMQAVRHNLRV